MPRRPAVELHHLGAATDFELLEDARDEWRAPSDVRAITRPRFTSYPFALGVASGAPASTSVVIWTRLAPQPLSGGGVGDEAIAVGWEVASDERFRRIVRRGTIDALPGRGHSVHVEVDDLAANRWYFYRFFAGDDASPEGRTRTLPAPSSRPSRLRIAYGSCQQFEQGYFAAHRHLADEDLDLMVFLGDYIYESSWGSDLVRRHTGGEPRRVVDYRNRHAQYKTDPDLQALHAQVPWLVTWDDHEVDNDYADQRSEDLDPRFLTRRAAGYQAYFEHMPLRWRQRPTGPDMDLYARYDFGRLARIHLLDCRQYRTPQACPRPGRGGANMVDGSSCTELFDEDRTMLGAAQEQWLTDGIGDAADRWNIIGSDTLMAPASPRVNGERQYWTDGWDGYPAARRRLLEAIDQAAARSCVVIGGDVHATFAANLLLDTAGSAGRVVASEVCGTSITSQGRSKAQIDAIKAANPHIRYADASRRGYVVFDVTPEEITARVRALTDVKRRDTGVTTAATFTIERGRPGVRI
jgi:alkaline phosphatase D